MLFQELEKFFDLIYGLKSNFCATNWNSNVLERLGITCKSDTPGNVKQSCPDICNRIESGKYIL